MSKWMSYCLSMLIVTLAQADARVYQELPIREVTAFKDGHAFVLHEGLAARDVGGKVILEGLPTPVLGTFWAYCAESNMQLASVVAGEESVDCHDPVETWADMIRANDQQEVMVKERDVPEPYQAKILRLLDDKGQSEDPLLFLQTEEGTRVMPVHRIERLIFMQEPQDQVNAIKAAGCHDPTVGRI